jgi:hypothetical protein
VTQVHFYCRGRQKDFSSLPTMAGVGPRCNAMTRRPDFRISGFHGKCQWIKCFKTLDSSQALSLLNALVSV